MAFFVKNIFHEGSGGGSLSWEWKVCGRVSLRCCRALVQVICLGKKKLWFKCYNKSLVGEQRAGLSDLRDTYPLKFPADHKWHSPKPPPPPKPITQPSVWQMFGKNGCEAILEVTGREKVQNRREIIMGGVCPIVLIVELNVGRRRGTLLSAANAAACAALRIGLLQWYI